MLTCIVGLDDQVFIIIEVKNVIVHLCYNCALLLCSSIKIYLLFCYINQFFVVFV